VKNNKKLHGLVILTAFMAAACAKQNQIAGSTEPENYIVVLKKSEFQSATVSAKAARGGLRVSANAVVAQMLSDVSSDHDLAEPSQVFSQVLQGGVYKLSSDEAAELADNPKVAYIEKDQKVHINVQSQSNATWGLDRVDQAQLPLNKTYSYPDSAGRGVNVYVIDTGIRTTHKEFEGRAVSGFDSVDNDNNANDCNGHGTHVAGTIGSRTYGVAKNAKLIAVRVLDCEGSGTISGVIAGVEWVTAHHSKPAVANMSLGGGSSQALDDAIKASIRAGVTYAVAAGNENEDACNSSPSRVGDAITVGSTTSSDRRSDFSNFGSCVSVFGPGSDITSTWSDSDSATNKISGTSMATPHVAGVAALYLSEHASASPSEVKSALLGSSQSGRVTDAKGSPNKLISTAFLMGAPQPPPGPSVPKLSNNVPVSNLSDGTRSAEKTYTVEVPSGSKKLTVSSSGGRGDVDLYVKFGSKPTGSSYDCRPYKTGNNESCSLSSPRAGTFYVVLKTYAAYSGVTLKAVVEK
jgi:serine protease